MLSGPRLTCVVILAAAAAAALGADAGGRLKMDRLHGGNFRFGGVLGRRIDANVAKWLIPAPQANPGLLDMFARRDSGKPVKLVPWAGEFVGKYLISGVQALRMSDDARLRETLAAVVARLIALQADDGYIGPWPKRERLLGHWDLWGHYHVMLALSLWHEHTGDAKAIAAARKAADLVCGTYLDTDRRVHQAGSPEMNMSVIHVMARLYRKTGEKRYLRMSMEILKDFERAGDYFRTGLRGVAFFRTPRPRWESLHALQGLVELYRITGDERFRRAFLHHWASIRRFDMRNTGGFSSGEKATGDPYADSPIETCCVIAWQAVMLDALRLTGDPTIADDLELTTFNAVAGAQHPSGAWCTYNTPMNGRRVASHISIRFQARPDTPGLNCCSVNGPRGLGMLSEWAVMTADAALAVNYYGPMRVKTVLPDKTPIALEIKGDYPLGETATIVLELAQPRQLAVRLRIPRWSVNTRVSVNGLPVKNVRPGTYLELSRRWTGGDKVTLRFDMPVRYVAGDLAQHGRASLYRGPILLAHDPRLGPGGPPTLDVSKLGQAKRVDLPGKPPKNPPWLLVELPGAVRLCDFASAGATGGGYRSWLATTKKLRPPVPVTWKPADGQRVAKGAMHLLLRRSILAADEKRTAAVLISDSPTFERVALRHETPAARRIFVPAKHTRPLKPNTVYYWKVVARNAFGEAESVPPYKRFTIDPALPPAPDTPTGAFGERASDKMVTHAPLAGDVKPAYGRLLAASGWKPAPGAVELDGKSGRIIYGLDAFPDRDFTVAIRLRVTSLPKTNYGQVFSAWCGNMDAPLRLVVHKGKLHARIEAGKLYGTSGWLVQLGKWCHVAAVKRGPKLTLYINGRPHASANVPERLATGAHDFAIGGNPHFSGPEYLAARLADLRFYARALSDEQVGEVSRSAAGE